MQLGASDGKNVTTPIRGPLFTYHGNELTVPPQEIAMEYATNVPLKAGMPGPSFTWSCYASSLEEARQGFGTIDEPSNSKTRVRISPVVTERMDESLIVLSQHLEWSIADLVNVMPRKVCIR